MKKLVLRNKYLCYDIDSENIQCHNTVKSNIEELVERYNQSNLLLKNIVEKQDVNEQYIFDILDKWAKDRGVKTKK